MTGDSNCISHLERYKILYEKEKLSSANIYAALSNGHSFLPIRCSD